MYKWINPGTKLPDPYQWKFWFLVAFIMKLSLFLFLLAYWGGKGEIDGFWGLVFNDSYSYITPIENFVDNGFYDPDYRMPGYGIFYLPLYFFFDKATALNILIFFQLVLASAATYLLALTAHSLFKSKSHFYLTFFLMGISTYSNLFDASLLSESLSTSILVVLVFIFLNYLKRKKTSLLIVSGLLMVELIFLKPVYLPLLVLFLILIIRYSLKERKLILRRVFLFILPFLLVDGVWTIRNYRHHHKIAPLTTSVVITHYLDNPNLFLWDFLKSWGGSIVHWDVGAEIRWFGVGDSFGDGVEENIVIPDYIYTSQFNLDSLEIIKSKLKGYDQLTKEEKIACKAYLDNRLSRYTKSIKTEKPFVYYVRGPARLFADMLFHSGTYNLFPGPASKLNFIELMMKIFYSLLYLFILFSSFLGLILLFRRSIMMNEVLLVTGIAAYTILVFPIFLRFSEARYLVPAWPFLVICSVYAILFFQRAIMMKTKSNG